MSSSANLGVWPHEPPAVPRLIEVIRMLAEHSAIDFSDHAEVRMVERDIDTRDVLNVLKSGELKGDIEVGKNQGEWVCKIAAAPRYPDNKREVGTIVVVMRNSRLFIKTVEWEDKT